MALSAPRALFGVHSCAPYSRTDNTPYGILRVLGGSSLTLSGEQIKLMGGSNPYAWASEPGTITAELSLKVREYPDFLVELFLGKAPTANSAETAGAVSTLTNKYGTSTVNATTGIASALVIPTTGADNLKFSKFLVKVVSATTVDVYAYADADFSRGTDAEYSTDTLKIFAAQTIASGAALNLTAIGVKLTGGSGTIGMTIGDTATFQTRPINTKSMDVTVGATGDTNPEFGAIVFAQKRSNGEMFEIDLFRCVGNGLPLLFEEFKWSEAEIKVEALYDSTLNGIFSIRHVTPSSVG